MNPLKRLRIHIHRWLIPYGIDTRKKRGDRVVLETVIFPELLRSSQYQRILFVGCAWYTLHYPNLFRTKNFTTLEIDPSQQCFGAREHIIDSCERLEQYFQRGQLDCIVFNGVYGFGLDDPNAVDRTFTAMHHVLRDGGLLVFGRNDLPQHSPCTLNAIPSIAYFKPVVFPPLGCTEYSSDPTNRHVFQFLANQATKTIDRASNAIS